MEGERNNINDEEHYKAFGENIRIFEKSRYKINQIGNNDPDFNSFNMVNHDVEHFSDLAWELLGRYIADNNHLEGIGLVHCGLTNEKNASLVQTSKEVDITEGIGSLAQ